MSANVMFFGWNRSVPGRENLSNEHFSEFVQYLVGQQQAGMIDAWDAVFLDNHGGDMNGFFLIKGQSAKLYEMAASEAWATHMIRASMHLERSGSMMGVTGDLLMEQFQTWSSLIPS